MSKNYCVTHETVWFKKGAMKGYAHPIKDGEETVGWCNRPADFMETNAGPKEEPAGEETGMWWKELGEMIRAKDIDTAKPAGKLMRTAYYTKMMEVLNLKIEKGE